VNSNNLTNSNQISRRRFIKLTTAGTITAGLSYSRLLSAATKRQPNIIFIMADDLGYGHLSCYGQEKFQTPNIDRLADEGMKFEQFYAGYTVCAPSRSVLMTGLHHGHTPVRSNSGSSSLLENETTVAQVLKKAGYITGGFGKWGLGLENMPGVPSKKGFDEFYGFYHQVHAHFYYPYWIYLCWTVTTISSTSTLTTFCMKRQWILFGPVLKKDNRSSVTFLRLSHMWN